MRLQINVSENLAKKIEYYSNEFGVSKSAFCSMMLGQSVLGLDGAKDALTQVGKELLKNDNKQK